MSGTSLGIVCFRINPGGTDLDEDALTAINGCSPASSGRTARSSRPAMPRAVFALRLCILNHTTTWDDVRETLVTAVRFGTEALSKRAQGAS